jgi:predicted O-methyltransferase YrrM
MIDKSQLNHDGLRHAIERAQQIGSSIDLSSCAYGKNNVIPSYYYFLAGLCKSQGLSKILEIGTFMGGSALAMSKGISPEKCDVAKIVTVDIEARDTTQIDEVKQIARVIGDPLANPVFNKILGHFERRPIDLLFLDSTKKGRIVMSQLATFSLFLKPRFIVLDDITLNDSMESMWDNLQHLFGGFALNMVEDFPEIRKMAEINQNVVRHPGFGIIDYDSYLKTRVIQ